MAGLAATETRRPATPGRQPRGTALGLLRRLQDANRARRLRELRRRAGWADEARTAPSLEALMGSLYR